MAFPKTVDDSTWYLDSGATNHITTDIQRLSLKGTYLISTTIIVGDGTKVPIAAYGNAKLFCTTLPINLKDVLYVPRMKKNLISISKLT